MRWLTVSRCTFRLIWAAAARQHRALGLATAHPQGFGGRARAKAPRGQRTVVPRGMYLIATCSPVARSRSRYAMPKAPLCKCWICDPSGTRRAAQRDARAAPAPARATHPLVALGRSQLVGWLHHVWLRCERSSERPRGATRLCPTRTARQGSLAGHSAAARLRTGSGCARAGTRRPGGRGRGLSSDDWADLHFRSTTPRNSPSRSRCVWARLAAMGLPR